MDGKADPTSHDDDLGRFEIKYFAADVAKHISNNIMAWSLELRAFRQKQASNLPFPTRSVILL
jgi:hypothetical protein